MSSPPGSGGRWAGRRSSTCSPIISMNSSCLIIISSSSIIIVETMNIIISPIAIANIVIDTGILCIALYDCYE